MSGRVTGALAARDRAGGGVGAATSAAQATALSDPSSPTDDHSLPGYEGIVVSLGMFAVAMTIVAVVKLVIGI